MRTSRGRANDRETERDYQVEVKQASPLVSLDRGFENSKGAESEQSDGKSLTRRHQQASQDVTNVSHSKLAKLSSREIEHQQAMTRELKSGQYRTRN